MKAKIHFSNWSFGEVQNTICSATVLLAAIFGLTGCTTDRSGVVAKGNEKTLSEAARLRLGVVGVVAPANEASIGFDKPAGRVDYASEEAGKVAREIMALQLTGHPQIDAAISVLEAAVAPFAAAGTAITAVNHKMSPEKLTDCQGRVAEALREATDQSQFTERILSTAAEKGRRQLVPLDGLPISRTRVDTILEPRIEQVQLERKSASDTSFALRVKARVRLLEAASNRLLYDEPFEYVSGTALFVDWSMEQALAGVADTAYNALANDIVGRLFSEPLDGPILLGAGFKNAPIPGRYDFQYASNRGARRAFSRTLAEDKPELMLADYRAFNSGSIGIYSTSVVSHITIQRPLTKEEALTEALDDVRYQFDGLDEFPNFVVQLGVCAASLPVSLYEQTSAAIQGVTTKKLAKADAQLTAAVVQMHPHEQLARELAARLAPQTAQPVMLVKKPLPPGDPQQYARMQCVALGTLAALGPKQSAAAYLASQGADSALEVQITKASLEGKDGIDSPLTLCIEARALLYRTRDGRPIYSCPVQYRSEEHKFTQWAAHDGKLFREEMANCSRQFGEAISSELVAQHVVRPRSQPMIASAEK